MSATRILCVSTNDSNLSLVAHRRLRPSFPDQNKINLSSSASPNFKQLLTCDHTSLSNVTNNIPQRKFHRKFVVYNSIFGIPIPSGSPSSSWKGWLIGIVLSIILPSYRHKLSPYLLLKREEVDTIVETAELVLDVVEKAAEEVAEIADDLGDKLPDGGKLKSAVDLIEDVSREIVKDANVVEDLLNKVEKVEEEVESFIGPVIGQLNKVTEVDGNTADKLGEGPS